MKRVTHISKSPEETLALGDGWGREARAGWVIGLAGELGAGKTLLTRGIARGLGFAGRVHSPTFALVNLYEGGRLPMHHFDFYRLDQPESLHRADLLRWLEAPPGLSVVEWFDRWGLDWWKNLGIPLARQVFIVPRSETEREIHYEDPGD